MTFLKIRLQIFDPDAGRGGRWASDTVRYDDTKCGYDPSIESNDTPGTLVFSPQEEVTPRSPPLRSWQPLDTLDVEDGEMKKTFAERLQEPGDFEDPSDEGDSAPSSSDEPSEDEQADELEETARLVAGPAAEPYEYPV